MTVGYVVLLGTVTVFGGAAMFAFWWAMKTGQFDHPDRQASSIFGADEPVGMTTDDVLIPNSSPHAPREGLPHAEREDYGGRLGGSRR